MTRSKENGFTLIEIAIAVAILGVIMGGALELYGRVHAQQQIQITYGNMDAVVDALSVYVETAGRLPCPADPAAQDATFGWERGVKPSELPRGAEHFPVGHCDQKTGNGIIPFMTLGIPASVARDGWGRYYTYAVSPVFAQANDQIGAPSGTGKVHGRCRHPGWVSPSERYNRNAIKARFCCADQLPQAFDSDTDLFITHTAGGPALSPLRTSKDHYDDLAKTTTTVIDGAEIPVMDTSPIAAPAFVLLSHGPDGRGAWLGNGTNNRFNPPESGPEYTNASGDRIFVDGPWQLAPGPKYFDDIVRWMTQDGIMAAHGGLSCSYP
jgi:prepilin-type N-terminal cleavage/methylation domain-containing protein